MQIATWNVNSLAVRLPQVLDWLAANPDVGILGLQETKLSDDKFPAQAFADAGWQVQFFGQKTYNGVALISRQPLHDVVRNIPGMDCEMARGLSATGIAPDGQQLRVVCAYMPNGQAVGSDKYHYKLNWLQALTDWLREELAAHPQLALAGDFNIAPEDRDVHNPAAWAGQILCSDAERAAFKRMLSLGLKDSFRLFDQPEKAYSWWDYRMLGFQKNNGLRIDHILLSRPLAERCVAAGIDREMRKRERPSDHAPVTAELAE